MKKISIMAIVALLGGALYAQTKPITIPPAVKAAFAKKFPAATGVKWSKENATEFEAEFKNGAVEQAANFDASGNWVVTETEMKKAQLPAIVVKAVETELKGFKIEDGEKVEKPNAAVIYEVKAEKGKLTCSVHVSADGKILKKEVEKEEKEKKD
ncbi:PepSY-like domain-containing protein [Pedobacter fastidiosus]|uniref:PepSY-like domain-containing protein n=1 Tax=Pedobacter fastidiosus TaxID=2765361 RepID=A0ABR7KWI1_9SPHI|nr:PepSY-like domain-containing protein [Pedobacter fastidiosus]MBC6112459.1 PepSY-like domain-containing protein [Pedobacter fastidiosus]